MMEGFATAELIYQHFMNQFATYCEGDGMSQVCELTEKYLEENSEWIMAQLEEQRQASDGGIGDPYWYQVNLFYRQLQGIGAGKVVPYISSDRHGTVSPAI